MPTLNEIQNVILTAQLKMANMINDNRTQLTVGNNVVAWANIKRYNRNIQALSYQLNRPDYTSTTTNMLYDCLSGLVGSTGATSLDPTYQPPNQSIIIEQRLPPPLVIVYGDMTLAGTRYDNPLWAGFNPFLVYNNTTWLTLGVDYELVTTGGFILSPSGNVPAIYPGDQIRSITYASITNFNEPPPATPDGFTYTFPIVLS